MLLHSHHSAADWVWILSTDFGITVFTMTFLTWTLIIVNLFLLMLLLVHKIFGKQGILWQKKK